MQTEEYIRQEAIFLHSSWRAASTYVWAKFRERPDTYCYFEPLNEHLFTATAEVIDRFRPWSFANHPALEAPYLEEFRPLIDPGGGIPGFPAHLTFGRYCAASNDSLAELEAYLADLAKLAARLGRRPVYGFVRTDMRVGWFRARMPGTHIFIRREPRRQFLSMLRQAVQGNPYFLQRGPVILRHNTQSRPHHRYAHRRPFLLRNVSPLSQHLSPRDCPRDAGAYDCHAYARQPAASHARGNRVSAVLERN